MLRPHQHVAALAVLGGLFMAPASPLSAKDDKSDIAELRSKVDKANEKLSDIQSDLKKLTELLNGRKDSTGTPIPTEPGVLSQLRALKDNLDKIEKELTKLKEQTSSTSLRPAPIPPTPIPEIKTGKGIVKIVNDYPIEISMVINGISYRVAPSQARDVEIPVGEFSYQLVQSGAAATPSHIKEKETVTLRIK
jgi:hypothetical protein